jgi:histidyl-tRNA synthetase
MSKQKPSIPQGTRDFGPAEMRIREFIFDTLRSAFRHFGFAALETPAFENLDTLLGKYGEEGDRLIFRILNSGNYFSSFATDAALIDAKNASFPAFTNKITEKALRYDLTVPFARYVVMNQGNLAFPFKRYQIQPVWRADRPQKGRYREFYQCDVDVVGSDSLLNEFDLVQICEAGFKGLGITGVTLRINNRKLLQGIANWFGAGTRFVEFITILDKLDKVGEEGVFKEWAEKGFEIDPLRYTRFKELLNKDSQAKIDALSTLLLSEGPNEDAEKGLAELNQLFGLLKLLELNAIQVELDVFLARGLGYYTGTIFEAGTHDFRGSILGGGRYDNLTGVFGSPGLSGVGISFGADRIYDILVQRGLPSNEATQTRRVMLINFGGAAEEASIRLLTQLRKAGVAAELYPDAIKAGKQFQYAEKRGFSHAITIGDSELAEGVCNLKDMTTRSEQRLLLSEVAAALL